MHISVVQTSLFGIFFFSVNQQKMAHFLCVCIIFILFISYHVISFPRVKKIKTSIVNEQNRFSISYVCVLFCPSFLIILSLLHFGIHTLTY